jgi:hypothetical protein
MKRLLPILLVIAACGGSSDDVSNQDPSSAFERSASAYAASALRALDGTAFDVLDARDLADVVVGLCDGLGVGAMGVAAADLGIDAQDGEVAILLEVLRTGLDQVCPDRVAANLTAVYLDTISTAVGAAGVAYDEVSAIRAAPAVCTALEADDGAEAALLAVVEVLFGTRVPSIDDLQIDADQGLVAGSVLATATVLLCPDRLDEIEALVGSS